MAAKKKLYSRTKDPTLESQTFSVAFADFTITRHSTSKMVIEIPANIVDVTKVILNGKAFFKEGSVQKVIHVAPVKYMREHFEEVDSLHEVGYSKKGACEVVANKYNFNLESFRHQYYTRYANNKLSNELHK